MLLAETHWVSPSIKKSDLTIPLSLDDKIRVFEDRVLGWQLCVAEELYFGALGADGDRIANGIHHNGFAVLYILLSYFEMIPKYEAGDLSEDSGPWFKKGIKAVFPEIVGHTDEISILAGMWKGARNGLYHSAMTKKRVFVSGDAVCLDFDRAKQRLVVNPGIVAQRCIIHFEGYISRLRDSKNAQLRRNFERKFKRDIEPQVT